MDKAKLLYEMAKKNIDRQKMCEILGISRSAFYRKCKGISEFTQGEIQKIVDVLELESPVGVFFAEKCSKSYKNCERKASGAGFWGGGTYGNRKDKKACLWRESE